MVVRTGQDALAEPGPRRVGQASAFPKTLSANISHAGGARTPLRPATVAALFLA
jgi:hypothetical protein